LYELCAGNRLELTTCRQSDDILFNMCKFDNIMNVEKQNFPNNHSIKNVSYLHDTRIKINDMWMKKQAKKFHHKGDVLRLDKNPFDPHSQDVILCRNTPIICKINNQNLNIINNETPIICKINNEEKELEIDIKDFQSIFYVAYCITIHSSQGETFNESYTIHDWEKLDKRLRYVALTRSSNLSYINIV